MDPLTAFAAAGNVLQFVQLGVTFIGKVIEHVSEGGQSEYENIHGIVQQLLVSNAHLSEALAPNLILSNCAPGPAAALNLANQRCLKISKDFVHFLNHSQLTKPGQSWRSSMSALLPSFRSLVLPVRLYVRLI